MDPDTAKLAVQLQLADINDLLNGLYDGEDIPNGDVRTSFQIMRRDLQRQLQVLEGQVLTLLILRQEHANRLAFSRLMAEERQAYNDHALAMRLASLPAEDAEVLPCVDREDDLPGSDNDAQWEMAKELYAVAFAQDIENQAPLFEKTAASKPDSVKANPEAKVLGSKALTKYCVVCPCLLRLSGD